MKISSTQLEAFYAVARLRNFTKAAAAVSVTQSALSQRILNLEKDLETTLFIRDRGGIELTDSAEELLHYCQFQEKFENEFLSRLKSTQSKTLAGPLRIAGYSSVMRSVVAPSISPLLKSHPQISVNLQTREMRDLLPLLKRREADYIITDEKLEREEIVSIKLGNEYSVLIEGDRCHAPDTYLDHDDNDETTKRYLKLTKKLATLKHRHFLDDIYGLIDGVRNGLGRAVVPRHLIESQKGLHILQPSVLLENPVYLHFYRQPFYTHLHNAAVELLTNEAPKHLKG